MKREFLQNLKVGEQSLSKEVIDAIMEENGKDINAAKAVAVKPYADYETLRQENDSLKAKQEGMQVDGKTALQWKEDYENAVTEHKKALDGMAFQAVLDTAITASGGRNAKAITALLDVDALKESENQQQAIEAALSALKQESRYLFDGDVPPPYARGTGAYSGAQEKHPTTLAGALREKFERK